MADRPILFSKPMILALLAGTKFQTRCIIKPQPPAGWDRHCWYHAPQYGWTDEESPTSKWHVVRLLAQPGDRLWCREAWRPGYDADCWREDLGRVARPSDFDPKKTAIEYLADGEYELAGKNRPGIHMPRWASRLTLPVSDVKVERLNEITEEDAWAEGVCTWCEGLDRIPWTGLSQADRRALVHSTYGGAVNAYRHLWEAINGADSWAKNPWVSVTSFETHRQNIDAMKEAA